MERATSFRIWRWSLDSAESLSPLQAVVIARDGRIVANRGYRGHSPAAPTSIMSASKSVISALVGIAMVKGVLDGIDQFIAPILAKDLPVDPDAGT